MMRYASANHADPYDDYRPSRDAHYAYRDHHPRAEPAGAYRSHRESAAYWEPDDYRTPSHHGPRGEHHVRESRTHYRDSAAPTHRGGPPPPVDSAAAAAVAAAAVAAAGGVAGPSAVPGPVGNITNSDDFASKDSRVFVGNLNSLVLSKEDVYKIFGRLGRVTGISMHKGYAFVQFSSPGEARRALALEHGQTYAGQALDLNIVSQPKAKVATKPPGYDGYKRGLEENPSAAGPPAKRSRPLETGNPSLQRGNLVTLANSDHSQSAASHSGSGGSRREPSELQCAQCDAVFKSAWSLCLHFQQRHHFAIFRTRGKNGR